MAAAEPERGLSQEVLKEALADNNADQLREMARRLTRSVEGMQEVLAELDAERQTLQAETEQLNSTITLMMQELQKLHIGASNTVDPQLLEGPLDFVGRFWEKVKPRDTAYQTSEHVGEIKKPVTGEVQTPNVQQVGREVGQLVMQEAQKNLGKLGPVFQRAKGFLNEKQTELAGVVAARAKAMQQQQPQQQQQPAQRSKRQSGNAAASSSATAAASGATAAASGAAAAGTAAAAAAEPDASQEAAPAPAAATPTAAASAAATAVADAAAPAKVAEEEAPKPPSASGDRQPGAEDPIASTILIEAKLKVDDGSVLTLYVRASDRNKEVAQRFVQENSLKAWFQDPLTAWLKTVEDDAEKFPVKVEADLMEIRKKYSKSK